MIKKGKHLKTNQLLREQIECTTYYYSNLQWNWNSSTFNLACLSHNAKNL